MLKSEPTPAEIAAEVVPKSYFAPLEFENIFGLRAPLEVDLGCGDGAFLVAMGAANPDRNYLGIERLFGRVRSACRRINREQLPNVRVLRFEITYVVRHLLPPGSVSAFHLLFPDPWPKRRHANRRIVTRELLQSIHRALASDGTLQIATDQLEYFREIERLAAQTPEFALAEGAAGATAISTFEKRFRKDGAEIYRLLLRKVSASRNGVASQ